MRKTALQQLAIEIDSMIENTEKHSKERFHLEVLRKTVMKPYFEKEKITNKHFENILKRLIIIADRYEKERQGLFEDELVYLSDAKFIINSFEKTEERG